MKERGNIQLMALGQLDSHIEKMFLNTPYLNSNSRGLGNLPVKIFDLFKEKKTKNLCKPKIGSAS